MRSAGHGQFSSAPSASDPFACTQTRWAGRLQQGWAGKGRVRGCQQRIDQGEIPRAAVGSATVASSYALPACLPGLPAPSARQPAGMLAGLTLGASQGPINHPYRGLHTQGLRDDAVKLQQYNSSTHRGGQYSARQAQASSSGQYAAVAAAGVVEAWSGLAGQCTSNELHNETPASQPAPRPAASPSPP